MALNNDEGIWLLFVSAFISSTIAPGGSEAVLVYLLTQSGFSPYELLLSATLGNTLGALTTWWLGWLAAGGYPLRRLFGKHHEKMADWLQRRGSILLLLSWLPVVGDALCLAAGWLRLAFWPSLVAIAVGKLLRYTFVILLVLL